MWKNTFANIVIVINSYFVFVSFMTKSLKVGVYMNIQLYSRSSGKRKPSGHPRDPLEKQQEKVSVTGAGRLRE